MTPLLSPDVCYWHLADIGAGLNMSAFEGKADLPDPSSDAVNDPKRTRAASNHAGMTLCLSAKLIVRRPHFLRFLQLLDVLRR
jgi:hypothetical protein